MSFSSFTSALKFNTHSQLTQGTDCLLVLFLHLPSEGGTSSIAIGGNAKTGSTGGDSGHLFLTFGLSPLGNILTYKNLIY